MYVYSVLLCFFLLLLLLFNFSFFFFNDTATTEIYTLSLHDALPISRSARSRPSTSAAGRPIRRSFAPTPASRKPRLGPTDRKSTRLNSSHLVISYAVFCLKKKKKNSTK